MDSQVSTCIILWWLGYAGFVIVKHINQVATAVRQQIVN